jgi:glycyl-tRNA synthetase beta chain
MGYHYARNDGENEEVALALNEQYFPKGAGDSLPGTKTGAALALADRLDTLVGIFGIGQPPTGNKDPFALRRAALGVLNIIVQKQLPLDLKPLLELARSQFSDLAKADTVVADVQAYMIERFRAWYQGQGIATEVFLAVQAKNLSEPVDFDLRIHAVHEFSQLEAAAALAAANKRVSNILAKLDDPVSGDVDQQLLADDAEKALAKAVATLSQSVEPLLAQRDYSKVLNELAALREPVDTFFDQVMVMADDEHIRNNRLRLLNHLRGLFLQIADISLLVPAK